MQLVGKPQNVLRLTYAALMLHGQDHDQNVAVSLKSKSVTKTNM